MIRCTECNNSPCTCSKFIDGNDSLSDTIKPSILPYDLFGSPFDCKKQKRTPRFASPNSPLPADELDELQACIEKVNDLLRSLGSDSDQKNKRQLQLHFLKLRGASVKAKILCGFTLLEEDEEDDETEDPKEQEEPKKNKVVKKTGKLTTAGRDFIQINPVGSAVFVLYDKLLSVSQDDCKVEETEPEFIDANQKMRRELAFNFGEFVSKNPDFVNLFFGIPLYLQLKVYLGKDVKVKTDDGFFYGTLVRVDEGEIQILNHQNNKKELDIKEICYLEVLNLK